jgi:hypothetical protein
MESHHFHSFDWPDDLVKIINIAQEDVDEHTRREAKVIPLSLTGKNMEPALRALNAVCAEHKVKHLASIPVGLADEGAVLDHWAAQDNPGPEKLTLFADLPGDYTSLISRCARDQDVGD